MSKVEFRTAREIKELKQKQQGIDRVAQDIEDVKRIVLRVEAILGGLLERLDSIEQRLDRLERTVSVLSRESRYESRSRHEPKGYTTSSQAEPRTEKYQSGPRKAKATTAIEVLQKQGVIFEDEIIDKIRNRDAFFKRLEQDGAIIIESPTNRAAFIEEYLDEFVEKINKLNIVDANDAREKLSEREFKVFKHLTEAGALIKTQSGNWAIRA